MGKRATKQIFNGKEYKIKFVSSKLLNQEVDPPCIENETCLGLCDDPSRENPEIWIDRDLKGLEDLEVRLHEIFHANLPQRSEKFINQMGLDVSKALWDMGYRKVK